MLKFAFKNISSLIKEYRAIFIMFFMVFSLVAISLIYLHSFNLDTLNNGNNLDRYSRTYTIPVTMEKNEAENTAKEIERKMPKNKASVLLYLNELAEIDGIPIKMAAIYGDVDQKQISLDRGSLALDANEKEIIMDVRFYMNNARADMIHDVVKINGEGFRLQAVGYIGRENVEVLTTLAGLQAIDTEINEIGIVFEHRLSKEELRLLQEIVGPQYDVEIPPIYKPHLSRQFLNRFMLIFVLILMATVNIMGLYRYIVLRRKKEFLIYKIYGISNQKLLKLIVMETIVLVTLGFFLGTALFVILNPVISGWLKVSASPIVFLQTYLIELMCSVVAILPILYRLEKKEIISEYVREEGQ